MERGMELSSHMLGARKLQADDDNNTGPPQPVSESSGLSNPNSNGLPSSSVSNPLPPPHTPVHTPGHTPVHTPIHGCGSIDDLSTPGTDEKQRRHKTRWTKELKQSLIEAWGMAKSSLPSATSTLRNGDWKRITLLLNCKHNPSPPLSGTACRQMLNELLRRHRTYKSLYEMRDEVRYNIQDGSVQSEDHWNRYITNYPDWRWFYQKPFEYYESMEKSAVACQDNPFSMNLDEALRRYEHYNIPTSTPHRVVSPPARTRISTDPEYAETIIQCVQNNSQHIASLVQQVLTAVSYRPIENLLRTVVKLYETAISTEDLPEQVDRLREEKKNIISEIVDRMDVVDDSGNSTLPVFVDTNDIVTQVETLSSSFHNTGVLHQWMLNHTHKQFLNNQAVMYKQPDADTTGDSSGKRTRQDSSNAASEEDSPTRKRHRMTMASQP